MIHNELKTKLSRLPPNPGVYLMKDSNNNIFYIGKASNLRSRVRSYFSGHRDGRAFVPLLEKILRDIEVIVTANEKEALILESNLIKLHQPKYNVELKDDKNFIHLRVDLSQQYPRLEIVRRPAQDGARYFGPFTSAHSIRETLRIVNRYFGLRTCRPGIFRNRSRPCLRHQMHHCLAPCFLKVSVEEYQARLHSVILFLEGRSRELLKTLHQKMELASAQLNFEEAARLRDQLQATERTLEKQWVVTLNDWRCRDAIGIYTSKDNADVAIASTRGGVLIRMSNYRVKTHSFPLKEIISNFISRYYEKEREIPDEVLLPHEIDSCEAFQLWLEEKRGSNVNILYPRRGKRAALLKIAAENAFTCFKRRELMEESTAAAIGRLKEKLRLKKIPQRAECCDISILGGKDAVGSTVVFENGIESKAGYRRYQIKEVKGINDFAMIQEILKRRFSPKHLSEMPTPDLLIIDGGKGHLNAASSTLSQLGIHNIECVAIAKPRKNRGDEKKPERVFIQGVKLPVILRGGSPELKLIMHMRNEAHRFALSYHRKQRMKTTLSSPLDEIKGVGKKLRGNLLKSFGCVEKIAVAKPHELCRVQGVSEKLARKIIETLQKKIDDSC